MAQASDLEYFVCLDDDRIPLHGSMTLGRHLENDVVLAGEDVLDYHLRIEVGERGPRAIPLGESSLRLNGADRQEEKVGLVPGDRLDIGREVLVIAVERHGEPRAGDWRLYGPAGGAVHPVGALLTVGRAEDNGLQLQDDHVSRHHARFFACEDTVFLQDFGASNGTFVNGERLVGGCRLFHGDEVSFDRVRYQLVGRGGDLTPVNAHGGEAARTPLRSPAKDGSELAAEATEIAVAPATPDPPSPAASAPEAGPALLGVSEPVSGMTFRTGIGRTVIGRSDDCDVVIRDRTVSARHAELVVRPEGVTVTNLMATNGTWVNGAEVRSAQLHDGDMLRLGQVSLVFRNAPAPTPQRPWARNVQLALLGAAILLALLALYLLL